MYLPHFSLLLHSCRNKTFDSYGKPNNWSSMKCRNRLKWMKLKQVKVKKVQNMFKVKNKNTSKKLGSRRDLALVSTVQLVNQSSFLLHLTKEIYCSVRVLHLILTFSNVRRSSDYSMLLMYWVNRAWYGTWNFAVRRRLRYRMWYPGIKSTKFQVFSMFGSVSRWVEWWCLYSYSKIIGCVNQEN